MCISILPSEMKTTKILSIPVGGESLNHFLSYSNNVVNLSGTPNAMILPVPGIVKQEWFYDTTPFKFFMNDISDNCSYIYDYLGRPKIISRGVELSVNFKLGQYSIYLVPPNGSLIETISSIDTSIRPAIKNSFYDFFDEHYKNCSFVICLFDNNETIDVQPIAFEYLPNNPNLLYFPTMDCHNGEIPNLNDKVELDHIFLFEHTGQQPEGLVKNSTVCCFDVPSFLKERKYRSLIGDEEEFNGDTFIYINNMNETPFGKYPLIYRGTIDNHVAVNG
jgi:hypothetical protein